MSLSSLNQRNSIKTCKAITVTGKVFALFVKMEQLKYEFKK